MKEFLAMGGYAFYVWSSIGLFFVALMIDLLSLNNRETSAKRNIKSRLKRRGKK